MTCDWFLEIVDKSWKIDLELGNNQCAQWETTLVFHIDPFVPNASFHYSMHPMLPGGRERMHWELISWENVAPEKKDSYQVCYHLRIIHRMNN